MKRNLWILMTLALCTLVFSGVAGAADDVTGESPEAAINSSTLVEGDCGAEAELDDLGSLLTPEGESRTYTCGACSDSVCVGQQSRSLCGFSNGRYQYCTSLLGNICSDSSGFDCQCTSSGPY